jgi:predicted DNA-binding transcriptional regulator AlpA
VRKATILTIEQVAKRWNTTVAEVDKYLEEGKGPKHFEVAGQILFRAGEVEAWEMNHE